MKAIKSTLIYLSASVISKGAPFLLLPFLTKYLDPDEFGALAIFLVINSVYGAFVGMSVHANVTRSFFNRSRDELAVITGNVFFVLFTTTILYLLVSIFLVSFKDELFSIPTEYFLIFPFLALCAMVSQLYLTVLRNEGRAISFGIFEVSNAFLTVAVTLLFLVVFEFGWRSQVMGVSIVSLCLGFFGAFSLYKGKYLRFRFDKVEFQAILRLSVPLIPHVLGGIVITTSDRLLIEQMVSLSAVGLYSIGYSFGMVVTLFTDALIKVWSPWFYRQLVDPTVERKYEIVKYTYAYIVGIFIVAYVISTMGEFVLPYVVADKYASATQYIWWVALGYAMQGVYKIFFPYLVYISKTGFLAFSSLTAALLNFTLNCLLIPEYGALGAAYATVVSFAASALLVFEYQRRNYWMPWFLQGKQ